MNMTGHDANLNFVRRNQTGAVRAKQKRFALHLRHAVLDLKQVAHGDAFGDANDQVQLGFNAFPNGGSGTCGRHIDHRHIGAGLCLRVFDRGKNRNTLEIFTGFFRMHTRHKGSLAIGIGTRGARVILTRFTGNTLGDNFCIFINQNRHISIPGRII